MSSTNLIRVLEIWEKVQSCLLLRKLLIQGQRRAPRPSAYSLFTSFVGTDSVKRGAVIPDM